MPATHQSHRVSTAHVGFLSQTDGEVKKDTFYTSSRVTTLEYGRVGTLMMGAVPVRVVDCDDVGGWSDATWSKRDREGCHQVTWAHLDGP